MAARVVVPEMAEHHRSSSAATGSDAPGPAGAPAPGQPRSRSSLAARSGLRGLVCSPLEIAALRQIIPPKMQLVTPGIRPGGGESDDQKRTLSPREAMEAGADWLTVRAH